MKRNQVHFIVDMLSLAAFALMTSTGVLLHSLLPPGSGHFSVLWGMNRHEWGVIHFWISMALLILLVIHLLLNWRWIVAIVKGHRHENANYRLTLGVIGILALMLAAMMPLLMPVETTEHTGQGFRGGYQQK